MGYLTVSAAYFTPIRDFRANVRSITLLAVGLPIFTRVIVAIAAHSLIEEMTWPVAFVLGAIVSPSYALATTSIAQVVRLPRRLVTVLEGESLLNDATAVVAYRLASSLFVPLSGLKRRWCGIASERPVAPVARTAGGRTPG